MNELEPNSITHVPHNLVEQFSDDNILYSCRYRLGEKRLHRLETDGPAVVYRNGHEVYYNNDLCHRENGAASIGPNFLAHFINGKPHRLYAPAMIYSDGTEYWYKEGNLHRLDGPAITHGLSGIEEYWINGKYKTKQEYDDFCASIKQLAG